MINDLIEYFKNKKVLVLGFGKEGESTYKLIRKYLPNQKIYIADKKEHLKESSEILKKDDNVEVICGEKYLENLNDYDIIMKSPGISFAKINIEKYANKIKSQLELLLEFFEVFTIGITGTKGKSTTSSLIYNVLKEQNINCMFLGNIGIPAFDYIEKIEKNMLIVLEMSSHQLEYMKVSPNIALLLNIYEEHLDHYKSFEEYANAKCNIFKYQKASDYFLYNADNETINKLVKNIKAQEYEVSVKEKLNSKQDNAVCVNSDTIYLNEIKNNILNKNIHKNRIYLKENKVYINNKFIYNKNEPRNLIGDYNLNNIMFVLGVSEILNLNLNKTIKTISEFKTLEHRLELVGKYNDIIYYDNSIATVPMATICAIEALKKVNTLIIGGMDRGLDYTEFIKYLNESNIQNIICMPKTGHDIAKKLKKEVYIVNTLEEAVETAKKITEKNKICLLSPAAASYGFFKNFEEKGNLYKELVKKQTEEIDNKIN